MGTVSQALIDFVKGCEGPFQAHAFWDYQQYSIGFGTKANSPTEVITLDEANSRLQTELQKSVDDVLNVVKVPLNDNQLAALASLDYNGGSIAQYPHLMSDLNSGNFAAAANDFLDINKAGGSVSLGLTKRRQAESQLFLGKSTSSNVNQPSTQNSLTSNPTQAISQALSSLGSVIQSALLQGKNCPPPPFNQRDRIIYIGCATLAGAPLLGNALGSGYAAPAVNSLTPNVQPINTSTPPSKPYDGQLKPGGLIVPMKKGTYTVTSGFGPRTPPPGGGSSYHKGIDMGAPKGTPIYAAADGVAQYVRTDNTGPAQGYGHVIYLQHAGGLITRYGHMSVEYIKEGDTVKQGQLIAGVGSFGHSTGFHLHFEIRPNDVPQNPTKFLNF